MKSSQTIINSISNFDPFTSEWIELDHLLDKLCHTGEQNKHIGELFKVFERFPNADGDGVLWSFIHALESIQNYEGELLKSLQTQPSDMGLIMLNRIKNSGENKIEGIEIDQLIQQLKTHPRISPSTLIFLEELNEKQ